MILWLIYIMAKRDILLKVAHKIRRLRGLRGMSQEKLAEKSDLHPTFIGKIERAEINPTIVSLEKIARAFKIPISELLTFPEDRKIYDENIETLVSSLNKAVKELKNAYKLAHSFKPVKKR